VNRQCVVEVLPLDDNFLLARHFTANPAATDLLKYTPQNQFLVCSSAAL
jgi:hypothetical protein